MLTRNRGQYTGDTVVFGKHYSVYNGRLCMNTDSGLIYYGGYGVFLSTPPDTSFYYPLWFKYPTFRGDSFDHSTNVASIDTIVHVPAGNFSCIKYQVFDGAILSNDTYVSPGIGIIKMVSYYGSRDPANPLQVQNNTELQSYTLR